MNNSKIEDVSNIETGRKNDDFLPHINVGIFWLVDGAIVGDAVTLENAEPYAEALQYGGHFEFWENLKVFSVTGRKLKSHAYDYYPRGRMVFFPKRQTARLYVDYCMGSEVLIKALDFFKHQKYEIEIESDAHYRCAGCNRNYAE